MKQIFRTIRFGVSSIIGLVFVFLGTCTAALYGGVFGYIVGWLAGAIIIKIVGCANEAELVMVIMDFTTIFSIIISSIIVFFYFGFQFIKDWWGWAKNEKKELIDNYAT